MFEGDKVRVVYYDLHGKRQIIIGWVVNIGKDGPSIMVNHLGMHDLDWRGIRELKVYDGVEAVTV